VKFFFYIFSLHFQFQFTFAEVSLHCWLGVFFMVKVSGSRFLPLSQIFALFIVMILVASSVVFAQTTSPVSSQMVVSSSSSPVVTSSVVEPNHVGSGCPFQVLEGNLLYLKAEGFDPDPEIGPAGELLWSYAYPVAPYGLWQTKLGDAGRYYTAVRVSDGDLADTVSFCIDVVAQPQGVSHATVNHAPKLFGVDDITIREGQKVFFRPTCIDPDGDDVSISVVGPLSVPVFQSVVGDAGDYSMTITCSDSNGASSSEIQHVVVLPDNRAPLISITNVTAYEGEMIALRPAVYDPDGDYVTVSVSEPFSPDGLWQTSVGDSGLYTVFVYASDGVALSKQPVIVQILPLPHAPVQYQPVYPAPQPPVIIETKQEVQPVQVVQPQSSLGVVEIVYPSAQQPVVCPYAQPQPTQVVEVHQQPQAVVCPYTQPAQTTQIVYSQPQQPVVCPYVQPQATRVVEIKSQPQQPVVCPYVQPQATQVVEIKSQPQAAVVCPYVQQVQNTQVVEVQQNVQKPVCPYVQNQVVEVKTQPTQQPVVCPYAQQTAPSVQVNVVCPQSQPQVIVQQPVVQNTASQPVNTVQCPYVAQANVQPVQTNVVKCPLDPAPQGGSDDIQVVYNQPSGSGNGAVADGSACPGLGVDDLSKLTPRERIERWENCQCHGSYDP
jgi:hypothetical protein